MIDLSKDALVLKASSIAGVCNRLKKELPVHAEVTIKNNRPPEIRVREGFWRGASLIIDDTGRELKLVRIMHRIPSFIAKVIIFVASVAIFSIIMMIVLGAVVGEFTPVVFGIGGMAGFAMYTIIERVFVAKIRRSWTPELHQAIAKINEYKSSADQSIADTYSPPVIRMRPTGVTIVSWTLIILSVIQLLSILVPGLEIFSIWSNRFIQVDFRNVFEFFGRGLMNFVFDLWPFAYFGMIIFDIFSLVVTLVIGTFMLKGAGWARWLFIGWGAFGILVTFGAIYFRLTFIIPRLLIYVLFTAVLLNKKSSEFFSRQQ